MVRLITIWIYPRTKMNKQNLKIIGIIPARYGSTRFPGKPLVKILGKTLIQRTYENAIASPLLEEVWVATDDVRILHHVKDFGGNAVMTSSSCLTGSDRLVEVLQNEKRFQNVDYVINIQGDEPCIEQNVIQEVITALTQNPQAVMSTAIMRLESQEEAHNPSVVKCTIDQNGNALYFSRSLIPGGKEQKFLLGIAYYKHLGIYGYQKEFLIQYAKLPPTPLQIAEDLEQLKVLENGYQIKTAIVESNSIGVDTPEDIKKVEQLICKQNTFLSQAESVHP